MKIQGVVEVEGVRLHVDIEAPDNKEDIYVTNIHPNCLIVPKERWWVQYLGLSSDVLQELREQKIKNLGQLIDGQWQLSRNGLSEQTTKELEQAIARLKEMALLFEQPTPEEIAREVAGFPIPELIQREEPIAEKLVAAGLEGKAPLDTSVRELKISERMQDALIVIRQARTLGAALALGRGRITMTPTITAQDVNKFEKELARLGHVLQDAPQQEVGNDTEE